MYITFNKTIQFSNYNNSINTEFFLCRIKALFDIYFIQESGSKNSCCSFHKMGGEIIDVSISNRTSTHIIKIDDTERHEIYNSSVSFNTPNLNYIIHELESIIFNIYQYPWDHGKFGKRVYRYFCFIYLDLIIKNKDQVVNEQIRAVELYDEINDLIIKLNRLKDENILMVDCSRRPKDLCIDNCKWINDGVDEKCVNLIINTMLSNREDSIFNSICVGINNIINNLNIDYQNLGQNSQQIDKFIHFLNSINKNLLIFQEFESIDVGGPIMRQPSDSFTLGSDSYKTKYLKYKNKYKLTKQKGGFNTCDKKKDQFILPLIINSFTKLDSFPLENRLTDSFNHIYRKLLVLFNSNRKTQQKFISYDDEELYFSPLFHNYNINISALAFLSFLIEYQMFLNFYIDFNPKELNYNTPNNKRNNSYRSLNWKGPKIPRIYRNSIHKADIILIMNLFCSELDRLYSRFMVTLISDLANKLNSTYDKTKVLVLPPSSLNERLLNQQTKFDYIYYNWKDRILQESISNEELTQINIKDIDNCIKDAILYTLDQTSTDNQYATDATGFFSWMYLFPYEEKNKSKKFGSCITSTCLEVYLLHRIYEDPSNISIGIESHVSGPHAFWKKTQEKTGINMSHWTTIWYSYCKRDDKRWPYIFRYMAGGTLQLDVASERGAINLQSNKKTFLQVLVYPIYDNYKEYIKTNYRELKDSRKKLRQLDKAFDEFDRLVNEML